MRMCGCGEADVGRLFQARGGGYRTGGLYRTLLQAVRLRNLTVFLRLRNKNITVRNFSSFSQLKLYTVPGLHHRHFGGCLFFHSYCPGLGILLDHLKGVVMDGNHLPGFDEFYGAQSVIGPHGEVIPNG